MRKWGQVVQVAFTYVGTIVGAGFASGQEILQFFTQYGRIATFMIILTTLFMIWLGIKIMLLANKYGAKSYEDLNKLLFGAQFGRWISWFMMVILSGTSMVMLAGAGTLFTEQFNLSFQSGLLLTLVLSYLVLSKGIEAIMKVNSLVVPFMIAFTLIVVWHTWSMPNHHGWLQMTSNYPLWRIWFSPILYAAFNLISAQSVLVPLGSTIHNRTVLFLGGLLGGIIIGLMLLAAHFALSAQMPGIQQFQIPMGHIIRRLGRWIQLVYILIIFGEIFTTYIADIYGLCMQLQQKIKIHPQTLLSILLFSSYIFSQFGFSMLLSILYPIFGGVSLIWFVMIIYRGKMVGANHI